MAPKTVETFEAKIEKAITEVVLKMGLKNLPLLPFHQTFQMMAKAAAAVYEAAAENRRPSDRLNMNCSTTGLCDAYRKRKNAGR